MRTRRHIDSSSIIAHPVDFDIPLFSAGGIANTVQTPYNTAPYITGSNIARLGHGSQNSWSKLWIPIVKSAPVRVIFTWKSVPKKSIDGSSDIYLGTQWKQWHDSPWSYRSDVIVTYLCYSAVNRHYMTPWSSIHGQEGLIDANCIGLRFTHYWHVLLITGTWAHRHGLFFSSKMDPVRVTKITQRFVETLNQF